MQNEINYEHIISIGSFCSVAMEIERIERRDGAYPFDWCISELEGVLKLIENDFKDFMVYDELMQNIVEHSHYMNQYGIQFFHDFNSYEPLKDQLHTVHKKYLRRIRRFYKSIKEPTLFVRYVRDQKEMNYITENYSTIMKLLKKFNLQNELILIINNDIDCYDVQCYKVEKDRNDTVARRFLEKNEELRNLFLSIPKKKKGIKVLFLKVVCKIKKRFVNNKKFILNSEYVHTKSYR